MDKQRLGLIIFGVILISIVLYSYNEFKQANNSYESYQEEYNKLRREYSQLSYKRKEIVFIDSGYNEMVEKSKELLEVEERFTKLHADKGYIEMRNSDEYKNIQLELGKFFANDVDRRIYKSPWNYDIDWRSSVQVGIEHNGRYNIMFIYSKENNTMMIVECKYSLEDATFSDIKIYNTEKGMKDHFYGDNSN